MNNFKEKNSVEVAEYLKQELASKERARKVIGSLILGVIRNVNIDTRKANEDICNNK